MSISLFVPGLAANQVECNAGFISISLFGPGPINKIDIGPSYWKCHSIIMPGSK